jgi:hypothetical protein
MCLNIRNRKASIELSFNLVFYTPPAFSLQKIYQVFDYFGELSEISANSPCVHPVFGPPFTP